MAIIISLIISIFLFFILQINGESLLDRHLYKTSFFQNQKNKAMSDFKTYVSNNNLSINDSEKMDEWVHENKYIDIYIFKNNNMLYDSTNRKEPLESEGNEPLILSGYSYNINFSDLRAQVYIMCYFEYKYYYILICINIAISLLCFIVITSLLIKKKISYIRTLENEIKILEGGDLNYEITIEDNDELSLLAQSINEMRKSFIERLRNEDEAKSANSELITAMSHDLRTPLTALVGYLDIIEYKKYKTEDNLKRYIHNSREKAYQIKSLSDKLFEYFILFNKQDELQFEEFNGNELLEQLFEDQFFMLNNQGFIFKIHSCESQFFIGLNLISMRRVFDNIFSNISKYADKSKAVEVRYYVENKELFISIENTINKNLKAISSTGIGLKTCKKIVESHGGEMLINKSDNTFNITIILNVKGNNL
ncbi:HAMP domain-containing histidine kinase [Clostridium gasigenes]|nr:HAMP domain-containing sensor histidine kinase [Clostridium gasigenes]MBU3104241.1 HAMP domain-containing histidine kinase [Clostridium gasigenes]MBU3136781.1 HAMP domain-containing histidine kinase [Clostridium gasigenes]